MEIHGAFEKSLVWGVLNHFHLQFLLPIWNLKASHWKEFHIFFETWGDNCQVIHSDLDPFWNLFVSSCLSTWIEHTRTHYLHGSILNLASWIPKFLLMGFNFQWSSPPRLYSRAVSGRALGSDPPFKCFISHRKPRSFHCGVELWQRCSLNAWILHLATGVDLSFSK